MERIHLAPPWVSEDAVRRAASVLRSGGVALLPAEGVYGLHVIAMDARAVERLRLLKPRDRGKGFIGLIAEPRDLDSWGIPDPRATELAQAHWPGPLTLVLKASAAAPESLIGPGGTVALRCPGTAFLRAVVVAAGGLLVSTSANAPGEPPPVRAEGPFAERADLVVDQGALSGIPSTVVAVEGGRVRVLREGAVRIPRSP